MVDAQSRTIAASAALWCATEAGQYQLPSDEDTGRSPIASGRYTTTEHSKMKKVTTNIATLTSPNWRGDHGVRATLLPAGSLVNTLKFPADAKGFRAILSGTLLGRRTGAYLWEPVANAKTTDLSSPMTKDLPINSTKVFLDNVSGFRIGDGITLAAGATTEVKTITAIDRANASVSFTATTNAYTLLNSALVKLTTAVAQDEFYLLCYDIENAAENSEVPALYRHKSLVRFNFLPGYPFTGLANVEAQIRSQYGCISSI